MKLFQSEMIKIVQLRTLRSEIPFLGSKSHIYAQQKHFQALNNQKSHFQGLSNPKAFLGSEKNILNPNRNVFRLSNSTFKLSINIFRL